MKLNEVLKHKNYRSRLLLIGVCAVCLAILAVFNIHKSNIQQYSTQLNDELSRLNLPLTEPYRNEGLGPGFCNRPCIKLDRVYAGNLKLDPVRQAITTTLAAKGYTNIHNIKQVISADKGNFSLAIYSEEVSPSHHIDIYISVLK